MPAFADSNQLCIRDATNEKKFIRLNMQGYAWMRLDRFEYACAFLSWGTIQHKWAYSNIFKHNISKPIQANPGISKQSKHMQTYSNIFMHSRAYSNISNTYSSISNHIQAEPGVFNHTYLRIFKHLHVQSKANQTKTGSKEKQSITKGREAKRSEAKQSNMCYPHTHENKFSHAELRYINFGRFSVPWHPCV